MFVSDLAYCSLSECILIHIYFPSYPKGSKSFRHSGALPCLDLETVIAKSCRYSSLTFFQPRASNKGADDVHSSEPVIICAALLCIFCNLVSRVSPQLPSTEIP